VKHGARVAQRLRRLRWQLTALFTGATAACLAALAGVAIVQDSGSRVKQFDSQLDTRAVAITRTVTYDKDRNRVDIGRVQDDTFAHGPDLLLIFDYTMDPHGQLVYPQYPPVSPPDLAALRAMKPGSGWDRDPSPRNVHGAVGPLRAVVQSVAGAQKQGEVEDVEVAAMVVVLGDSTSTLRAHEQIRRRLIVAVVLLTELAAVGGHLLSRLSMRPATRALTQQEQFLAEAAHELRTPLATLRLVAQAGADDPRRADHALRETVRLADRLGTLMAGLLTRARLQAGAHELELLRMRLDQAVEQTVEDLPDVADAVTVTTEPTIVRADPELVGQAVRNLVENALQHGRGPDGTARVEVRVADGALSIRDHGAGPAVPSPAAGTGIGLAIVRWVATLHSGSFSLEAAPGGGTVATLRFIN
jgi:two-component system OmpR family sensor kinase